MHTAAAILKGAAWGLAGTLATVAVVAGALVAALVAAVLASRVVVLTVAGLASQPPHARLARIAARRRSLRPSPSVPKYSSTV